MTVKELIEKLQEEDQDLEVVIKDGEGYEYTGIFIDGEGSHNGAAALVIEAL